MSNRLRSAGVLITARDTGYVLLLLRSEDGGSPAMWSIPGGRLEDGESARDAMLRELEEETGFSGTLDVRDMLPEPNGRYATFLATVPTAFEVELNDEHVDAGWFDPASLPTPTHRNVCRVLQGSSARRSAR